MKVKLRLDLPVEATFLLVALKDRYEKVVSNELLWDAWELSANKRMQEGLKKYLEKQGIK